jgi:hypothetical protein
MLRIAVLAASLALLAPQVALAQAEAGHVWSVNELRAKPGQESAYTQAIQEFDQPLTEELIRRGGAVSQMMLIKQAGNMADGTHLLIIEFPSWEAYINSDQAYDEASNSLFGRPYAELAAEEFVPMRDVIRRDVYLAPPEPR